MQRKTVNLNDEDEKALRPYFREGPERRELARLAGEQRVEYSDSAALRALAILGARAVREKLEEAGYEKLAASSTEEDRAFAEEALRMAEEAWADDEW